MIRTIATLLAAGALAGCWGAPPNEKILNGLCVDLLSGDERIVEDIAGRAQTDVAGFCSCYAATIVADDAKTAVEENLKQVTAAGAAKERELNAAIDAARWLKEG